MVYKFTLPHISLEFTQNVKTKVQKIALNCDSTRFATVDHLGFLNLYNLTENKDLPQPELERKEVWNVVWSKDAPLCLATNEKQRIVFIEDQEAEQPIQCDSYVCEYANMQLVSARIEKLMKSADENLKVNEFITYQD